MKKYNWIIHVICNGYRTDQMRNCHTHGMEKYQHMDFQIVLNYPDDHIGYLLNTICEKVVRGERFSAGDMVAGLYEDCAIRLDSAIESGRPVLRLIIPDKYNRFPEEPLCMEEYKGQIFDIDFDTPEYLPGSGKFKC